MASLAPPTAFCTLPAAFSAAPSACVFASPVTFPTASLTAPLTRRAAPSTRSLSISVLRSCPSSTRGSAFWFLQWQATAEIMHPSISAARALFPLHCFGGSVSDSVEARASWPTMSIPAVAGVRKLAGRLSSDPASSAPDLGPRGPDRSFKIYGSSWNSVPFSLNFPRWSAYSSTASPRLNSTRNRPGCRPSSLSDLSESWPIML
jgi:hypothetical protein